MKFPAILVVGFLSILGAADQSRLSPRFQTVYIVSMANSLDQHLASRLTSGRALWVVLQPSNADAVLTDSLEEDFWTWLDRNYPPPPGSAVAFRGTPDGRSYSPWGRRRGTIFLVDPRKRIVLWSTYELPKDSSPSSLDRSAYRITNQLRAALGRR